jgi:hypothetical protein
LLNVALNTINQPTNQMWNSSRPLFCLPIYTILYCFTSFAILNPLWIWKTCNLLVSNIQVYVL